MANVIVNPQQFTLCVYDAGRIAELVSEAAAKVGLPSDETIVVEVDETTPLQRINLVATEPITLDVEGGALEDPKVPRHLGDKELLGNVGGPLFRAFDLRQPGFADAPAEQALSLTERAAWDVYTIGRCARVGLPAQRQRRLYAFRNRHGFTDVADAVFERLWTADALTWADIQAACQETAAARG